MGKTGLLLGTSQKFSSGFGTQDFSASCNVMKSWTAFVLMLGFPQAPIVDANVFLIFIHHIPDGISNQFSIYSDGTTFTPFSILNLNILIRSKRELITKPIFSFFLNWGKVLRVNFNTFKTEQPTNNQLRHPTLSSVSMADGDLKESDSLCLIRKTFSAVMKWKNCIVSITTFAGMTVGSVCRVRYMSLIYLSEIFVNLPFNHA